ncbi:MAG: hypothetical protein A2038_15815 [Deltaproteobacteria bacterium GWA2_57_13]|nr:MAG: hypothetical protein A2038_15815 [Deltaproteobacteria bacterium GWA2_57_13]
MARLKASNPEIWKRDSLALLAEERCPVCVRLAREIPRHFFWFVNEHYYEVETITELRQSYGFCPAHTMDLLQTRSGSVMTTVFSYLTEYALSRLEYARALLDHPRSGRPGRFLCRKAAEALRPRRVCRACRDLGWQEDHMMTVLLQSLPDPDVQRAYEQSPGLCLPHLHRAGRLAGWDASLFLIAHTRQRLREAESASHAYNGLLEVVAGIDHGRILRRRSGKGKEMSSSKIQQGLPSRSWSPKFDWFLAEIGEPGCLVCNACAQSFGHYLGWLAREMKLVRSPSEHWDPSWRVCPSHFWDLYASGHEHAAELIAGHTALEWLWKLEDLSLHLADRPSRRLMGRMVAVFAALSQRSGGSMEKPDGLWGMVSGLLESPEAKLNRMRAVAFRDESCEACTHLRVTTYRTLDFLLRIMEAPAGRDAYANGSGLCLRHCIAAASIADNPAALSEILQTQIVRLRTLEWELEEYSRKINWSVRYEPKGPEQDAWLRAAQRFCGVGLGDG